MTLLALIPLHRTGLFEDWEAAAEADERNDTRALEVEDCGRCLFCRRAVSPPDEFCSSYCAEEHDLMLDRDREAKRG